MNRPEKLTFQLAGMGCDGCVTAVENAVMVLPGVAYVGVSLSAGTMTVRPGPGFDPAALAIVVAGLGYGIDGEQASGADCPCIGYNRTA
ncbi:heavy-metal-associated domain-containing protein [Devosia riboflavina]|uniref:heavy-metal-associated domain-containing protein n=1 Tax=Devosia riboflavina TaxID=46914 RepID=UPI00068E457D|nr:heavy metal-associated domain-containing protein [Devosia riboflavina]